MLMVSTAVDPVILPQGSHVFSAFVVNRAMRFCQDHILWKMKPGPCCLGKDQRQADTRRLERHADNPAAGLSDASSQHAGLLQVSS